MHICVKRTIAVSLGVGMFDVFFTDSHTVIDTDLKVMVPYRLVISIHLMLI